LYHVWLSPCTGWLHDADFNPKLLPNLASELQLGRINSKTVGILYGQLKNTEDDFMA